MGGSVPLGAENLSEWVEQVWQARRERADRNGDTLASTEHDMGEKRTSVERSAVAETLEQAIKQRAVKWLEETQFLVGLLHELLDENERLRARVTALEQGFQRHGEEKGAPRRERKDVVEVSPTGSLDMATASRMKLQDYLDAGRVRIVLDLGSVNYIDSAGLGEIVRAMKRAREAGGDIRLCNLHDDVLRIFEITGLDKAIAIYPTREDAVVWD